MATIATTHATASRDQWLEARLDLLKAEKELTRKSDEVAKQRQSLPWVKVDKDYRFETCQGEESLKDLFRGRTQLLVYHLMFGPDYTAPCASCSMIADGFNGFWEHLYHHDVMFGPGYTAPCASCSMIADGFNGFWEHLYHHDVMLWAVSRAPYEKIKAHKETAGWGFPWASSAGSDFNSDYFVGFSDAEQDHGYRYNFEDKAPLPAEMPAEPGSHAGMCGVDWRTFLKEMPGMSAFVLEDGEIYHTYSAYARGLDGLWGAYQWLDRAPLGRNEGASGPWWKRRYEYGAL